MIPEKMGFGRYCGSNLIVEDAVKNLGQVSIEGVATPVSQNRALEPEPEPASEV